MAVGELRKFAEDFTVEFRRLEEPADIAAFSRPHDNGAIFVTAVTPAAVELAEKLSPDGWASTEMPSGGWRVLAGRSDALLWFGLRL
jgi:hypothetical protein